MAPGCALGSGALYRGILLGEPTSSNTGPSLLSSIAVAIGGAAEAAAAAGTGEVAVGEGGSC